MSLPSHNIFFSTVVFFPVFPPIVSGDTHPLCQEFGELITHTCTRAHIHTHTIFSSFFTNWKWDTGAEAQSVIECDSWLPLNHNWRVSPGLLPSHSGFNPPIQCQAQRLRQQRTEWTCSKQTPPCKLTDLCMWAQQSWCKDPGERTKRGTVLSEPQKPHPSVNTCHVNCSPTTQMHLYFCLTCLAV